MLFHWGMAILIIGLLIVGFYMTELPIGVKKLTLYRYHKEFGILILMLVAFRLGWRWKSIIPPLPSHLAWWQKMGAHSVHYALYGFMIVNPLTGWMLSSSAGLSVSFFGWFVLPDLVSPNPHLREILTLIHHLLAYGLVAAICAHVGAALQHHFYYKDTILKRMLPWTSNSL